MNASTRELPTDPAELIQIIARQNAIIVERDEQIAQRDAVIAERERHIVEMQARHKAQMDAILRRLYGPRSESFDPTHRSNPASALWTCSRRTDSRR